MQNVNKGKKFPPEIYTEGEIEALIRCCSNRAPTGIRNRALLVVLVRGALRISEALALRCKDVDLDAGTIRILHGKGDKYRTIGIDPGTGEILRRWIDRRADLGIKRSKPLFCTLKGDTIKTAYIRALLPRLAEKAGIDKRVHAHGLRHTGAVQMAREGIPLPMISKQLGHSSMVTTERYLNHISPEQLINMMKQRDWDYEKL